VLILLAAAFCAIGERTRAGSTTVHNPKCDGRYGL
jgi:hypothetical protein